MRTLVSAIFLGLLCGCGVVRHNETLFGLYRLTLNGQSVSLRLLADRTYTEELRDKDGTVETTTNHWELREDCVYLNGFLNPQGSTPEDIFPTNTRRTKHGTYIFDACMEPKRIF